MAKIDITDPSHGWCIATDQAALAAKLVERGQPDLALLVESTTIPPSRGWADLTDGMMLLVDP